MSISSFIILGVGLSVDSLAASITTGACSIKLRVSQIFKVALYMAVFQASMPLIGWFIGSSFKGLVAAYDHWIALFLLGSIGGKLIYDGLRKAEEETSCFCPSNHLVLAGMALATSIDALVVGIGFGVLSIHIWMAVFIIGITTFFFSVAGVLLGMTIGERLNRGLEVLGGLVLIGMGFKIFLSHTIEFIK
ncbi:manganese efflux pump MntP [Marinilabilia salmonicolor]|uniref:manganese efflux pump MntP n=1 Tax=Marinilabilia salmonicolor TaxID=989 RepID=UPI0002F083C9|nr:manganese efflux pump MntP family protein [Marinilabilia salmonicolor]